MKRVLVLGAGLVSRPLVAHLAGYGDLAVTVADLSAAKAEQVLRGTAGGRAVGVSLDDAAALDALVRNADIVVSLLPYTLHPQVARVAVACRVPLVTTSYVSPDMRAQDGAARAAGVILLNEIGLDPGLDHMSAMRTIHRLRDDGARLTSFRSCCGGLPASEANTNPWGYKFSWSPKGVLAAGRNAARWLENGRVVEVPGERLFTQAAPYDVPGLGAFEVYPNRDSVSYVATYGIEGVTTMFRGTLRYPGWCETLDAVSRLGLLDDEARTWPEGTTYRQFMSAFAVPGEGPVTSRVAARLGIGEDGAVMNRLAFAGLFSDRALSGTSKAPIDALCDSMAASMAYAAGERDMIVLRHEFGVVLRNGGTSRRFATLIAFGEPGGDSAMARTVSLPAAVATRLILDGKIAATGVRIPVEPEIFEPVLHALEPAGITFVETRTTP
jgi:saccharopine dehydrogenase-like NADP-dependent oxidoreductase